MMTLPEFTLHRPQTVDEVMETARALLADGTDFDYIAGGTDLLMNYKNRLNCKPHLISLNNVDELKTKTSECIGASVTLRDLEHWDETPACMRDALNHLASPLVRETATIGGNLLVDTRCFFFNQSAFWRHSLGYCLKAEGDRCHVVPQKEICYATTSSDLAPNVIVMGGSVRLAGPNGKRTLALTDFYVNEGRAVHCLQDGEIITHIEIPADSRHLSTGYKKLRLRDTLDFPAMGVAIGVEIDNAGQLADLRIAIGGVSMAPLYLESVCAPFLGQKPTAELLDELAENTMNATQPVKNLVVPTRYRKKMVRVYTRRLLDELLSDRRVSVLHA
jgi:4-hydroxybenzoyl-CoA reductase subunit beta